ncbi:MAG: hypothetical protein IKD46_01995 [Lentisphaeria bacterium]|nr:hypothetical protein [Lentisphaeria bacterium]
MHLKQLAEHLKVSPVPGKDIAVSTNDALDIASIIRNAQLAGLSPELAEALREQSATLAGNKELAIYFNTIVSAVFTDTLSIDNCDLLPNKIGTLSQTEEYAFFALITLYAAPSRRAAFAAAGLPEDAADNAVKDVFIWMQHFYNNCRLAGLSGRILGWDVCVLNAYPLTLGRMQYILKKFHDPIYVYRNTATGQVLALAGDGEVFDRNGFANMEDAAADPQSWRASFRETADAVTGNPIHPCGRADKTPVTLDLAQWKLQFKQGDWTLDTHIPEGPDLKLDDCLESMTRALQFFREKNPDKEIKSFSCLSWLLDAQYEKILKPGSRIVAWMRQYYLFPIPESAADSLWRIFGEEGLKNGLANAPRNTSMQKNVAAFLEQGGILRSGGGFILPEDLAQYGNAPYRTAGK